MSKYQWPVLDRRELLRSGAGLALAAAMPWSNAQADAPSAESITLTPAPGRAALTGPRHPATEVWAYNASVPGPVIRLRQGEPFRSVVKNRLSEPTTVHWHGIRLPNNMDGVPGLTQPAIPPGGEFAYAFTPPDAGTFWYHPHADSLQQLGRGLSGALIVEEREPPQVDRELLWVIGDWRLTDDAQIASGFGNSMEAAMAGRVGNTVTINGRVPTQIAVRAGERIRLRLINTALARIMALNFEGHHPQVVALDGQPVAAPFELENEKLLLGPAMRADLVIDMEGDPGRTYTVSDDFYGGKLAYTLVSLAYEQESPLRQHPLHSPIILPPNPLPEPDIAQAERHILTIQGGMMGGTGMMGGMMGGAIWSINDVAGMNPDAMHNMQPVLTIARGRSVLITLKNDTAWWHPMHLHGFSFRVVARNGVPSPRRLWQDTVLIPPHETADIAFVADHPGDWMFHCHITDHQERGLMAVIRVA